jgi:hypothetical protein
MVKKRTQRAKPHSDGLTPPVESTGDHLHMLARAGISSVPVVGSPAVELFNTIIAPPIRKRQQEWMESVAQGLRRLEEKHKCVVDELKNNDAFIDTVMQAWQAAARTAKQEKRQALRNAVLNSAGPHPPDDAKQQMFVNLVDTLTVWHLRILDLFADPSTWLSAHGKTMPQWSTGGSLSQVLTAAFPELQGQREFYDIVGKDLYQRGLLNTDGFHSMLSGQGALAKRTTAFGDEFAAFISDPCDGK